MLKVAVYIDKLETLNLHQDTTIMLIREGLRRKHDIFLFHEDSISIKTGKVYSKVKKVELSEYLIREVAEEEIALENFNFIFIRKDPTIDINFLTKMSFLSMVESKAFMLNSPKGIMSFSEKILPFICDIPYIETLVTNNHSDLLAFKKEHKDIILKPLYKYCGQGIYVSLENDKNFLSISQLFIENSDKLPVIAQKYLQGVSFGDRRVIMLGGEPIGALNRMANQYDFRCNMKTGGEYYLHELSEKEIELCDLIRPTLLKYGLHLVGIDIIDGFLTEINTTAPTGLMQIKELGGIDLSKHFWTYVENYKNYCHEQ
jgi:glutathione synthase